MAIHNPASLFISGIFATCLINLPENGPLSAQTVSLSVKRNFDCLQQEADSDQFIQELLPTLTQVLIRGTVKRGLKMCSFFFFSFFSEKLPLFPWF